MIELWRIFEKKEKEGKIKRKLLFYQQNVSLLSLIIPVIIIVISLSLHRFIIQNRANDSGIDLF